MTFRRDHQRFPRLTIGALIVSLLSLCTTGIVQAESVTVEAVNRSGVRLTTPGNYVSVGGQEASNPPSKTADFVPGSQVLVGAGIQGLNMAPLQVTPVVGKTVWVDVPATGPNPRPGVLAEQTNGDGVTRVNVRFLQVVGSITFEAANRSGGLLNDIAGDATKKGFVQVPLGGRSVTRR